MSYGGQDHGSMGEGSMGGMGSSSDMTMMQMSFYWGKNAIILFPGWPKHSPAMYILALFVVLLLALAVELLSASQSYKTGTRPAAAAFSQATVYAIRMGLVYMVMLAVMSFNVGIFLAAVVGHAVGHYFVRVRALAMLNQNGTISGF